VKACREDSPGIERVPLMPTGAEPFVFFAGRPAAEWASDSWGFQCVGVLLVLKDAVWNNGRIVSDRTHARQYDLRPDYFSSVRRFTEALTKHQPYSTATAYSAL
jgi:hypothetical protein